MPPAIFLSASVPSPQRHIKYFETADPLAIAAAVSALVYVTLGRRLLVWGGHPAITPMVWAVADDMGVDYAAWVKLYQSRLFEDEFPAENALFQNVRYVDKIGDDLAASLAAMRDRMLCEHEYSAGVFIGGMEGIGDEYALFRKYHPKASIIPLASTGGASLELFERVGNFPDEFKTSLDYVGLLHQALNVPPQEARELGVLDSVIDAVAVEEDERLAGPDDDDIARDFLAD